VKVGLYRTSGLREGERIGVMQFNSKALIMLAVGERMGSSHRANMNVMVENRRRGGTR
jgi:hypothetical protein